MVAMTPERLEELRELVASHAVMIENGDWTQDAESDACRDLLAEIDRLTKELVSKDSEIEQLESQLDDMATM